MKNKILQHGGYRKGDRVATGKAPLLSIRIPKELLGRINKATKDSGLTRSELIRQILNKNL